MPNNQNQPESSLANFSFDDEQSFFGIETEEEDDAVTKVIKEVKGEKKNEAGNATKVDASDTAASEEDSNDTSFFGLDDEEEDDKPTKLTPEKEAEKQKAKAKAKVVKEEDEPEEGDDEEDDTEEDTTKVKKKVPEAAKPEQDDAKFYSTLASEMKEKGILQNVELKEDEEITEEKFFELQDEEIENRVEETLQAFFEDLDEDAKEFIKFKKNGGKTEDFIMTLTASASIGEVDLENPADVKKVLTYYITKHEGITEAEEVKDKLEWLKDSGKEKAYATKYLTAINTANEKARKEALKNAEDATKLKQEAAKKFSQELGSVLKSTEAVGIFAFTANDKKELNDYINSPSVKVGKNKYVPKFNQELGAILKAETPETKQKLLIIAKLIKNNFDTKDLVQKVKTKVTNDAKSKLKEAREGGVKASSSAKGSEVRSLDQYF
jgi:hypothetical protein